MTSRLGESFLAGRCPRCGNDTVVGFLFVNEHGEHMHTHYLCTFWPSGLGKGPNGTYAATQQCGWRGWTVPDPPCPTCGRPG